MSNETERLIKEQNKTIEEMRKTIEAQTALIQRLSAPETIVTGTLTPPNSLSEDN